VTGRAGRKKPREVDDLRGSAQVLLRVGLRYAARLLRRAAIKTNPPSIDARRALR